MHRLSPADTPAVAPVPEVAPATGSADRWTVRPGQCFWSIAESVLSERWGRSPTDAEIVPYWHRLIDANRHELAVRGDPDLIFPGQVFVVPAP
jgi:nucleoid-associated protein YgaU